MEAANWENFGEFPYFCEIFEIFNPIYGFIVQFIANIRAKKTLMKGWIIWGWEESLINTLSMLVIKKHSHLSLIS